jgi:hypothetical protein
MAEFPAPTPSPARVHGHAHGLVGHHPCWLRRPYWGGIYSTEHFRTCSYCACIHPGDMIEMLERGGSRFESAVKPGKFLFTTPNPVAGDLVRMGSAQGSVFARGHEPTDVRHKLRDPPKRGLAFVPTAQERLSGHFDRPALEVAPTMIVWPFYAEHTNDRQWPEIWAAASKGETNAAPLSGPEAH